MWKFLPRIITIQKGTCMPSEVFWDKDTKNRIYIWFALFAFSLLGLGARHLENAETRFGQFKKKWFPRFPEEDESEIFLGTPFWPHVTPPPEPGTSFSNPRKGKKGNFFSQCWHRMSGQMGLTSSSPRISRQGSVKAAGGSRPAKKKRQFQILINKKWPHSDPPRRFECQGTVCKTNFAWQIIRLFRRYWSSPGL